MLERIREFFESEDNRKVRRRYKYAVLKPYFDRLPNSVIKVMLDHDLITEDEFGKNICSDYEKNKRIGRVEEIIKQIT